MADVVAAGGEGRVGLWQVELQMGLLELVAGGVGPGQAGLALLNAGVGQPLEGVRVDQPQLLLQEQAPDAGVALQQSGRQWTRWRPPGAGSVERASGGCSRRLC